MLALQSGTAVAIASLQQKMAPKKEAKKRNIPPKTEAKKRNIAPKKEANKQNIAPQTKEEAKKAKRKAKEEAKKAMEEEAKKKAKYDERKELFAQWSLRWSQKSASEKQRAGSPQVWLTRRCQMANIEPPGPGVPGGGWT